MKLHRIQKMFFQSSNTLNAQIFCHLGEFGHIFSLQFGNVDRRSYVVALELLTGILIGIHIACRSFGRTVFAYPDFAKDILANGSMDKNKICICCSKCTEIMRTKGGTPGCVIRDRDVYMPIYKKQCMKG